MTFIPPPNWYDPAWKCVAMVTIDHTKVGGGTETQSDFPVLICGDQITDNRFWYRVLSTGADIVVTLDDGVTKLKRELVSISKTSKTMELYVRAPSLSHLVDPILYIYFHNPAGAETNDLDTWDSNFVMVHHMNDNPDTSTIQDSTTNNNDGAKVAAGQPVEAAGVFSGDKAQSFDAVNDKITVTDAATIRNIFDAGGTVEMVQDGNGAYLIVKRNPGWSMYINSSSGGFKRFNFLKDHATTDGSWYPTSRVVPVGSYSHIAITHNASNVANDPSFYVNGVLKTPVTEATTPDGAASSDAAKNLLIGTDSATFATSIKTEIRLSNVVRSAGWLATTSASIIGYATFLTVEFGTTYWEYTATEAGRTDYEIELRDQDGKVLFEFRDLIDASLDRQVNNPATVSLVCPLSPQIEMIIPSLVRPNAIWVWRNSERIFTGPFQISEIQHGETEAVKIDAQDYMIQLKSEIVKYYDSSAAVSTHIDQLLDYQENSVKVVMGTLDPTATISATIERDYIYNVLMHLRSILGGYMYVAPDRTLNWLWSIADNVNQRLEYRKNLISINKKVDWVNFGNRLYIYGDGCNLIDAGLTTEYIEDAASIAQYGLCIRELHESSFRTAAEMLRYAQIKIAEMAWPRVSYPVKIVDLADFGYTADQMNLGSWLVLVDPEIDIDVVVQIVRVTYDMVNTERISIELAARALDICDIVPGEYVL